MNIRQLITVFVIYAFVSIALLGGFSVILKGTFTEKYQVWTLGIEGSGKTIDAAKPAQSKPAQSTPWGIMKIRANEAWAKTTGISINIAVIDTGIQPDHPDLKANIKGGVNFVPTAKSWNDDNGHGTHVAGTIAALNNDIGVVGVGPNINLWAVKVLDRNGAGTWTNVIKGINWAIDNNMNVISMSLGGSSAPAELETAINNAVAKGIVVVAAAGNSGDGNIDTTEISYPAAYDNVIAVGATDSNDLAPSWSNTGNYVDVCAPGVSIYSTYKGSTYKTLSGTSMSTPHVSGTVALILTTPVGAYDKNGNGKWDSSEVQAKLQNTAVDLGTVGWDPQYGWGRIDAFSAVS